MNGKYIISKISDDNKLCVEKVLTFDQFLIHLEEHLDDAGSLFDNSGAYLDIDKLEHIKHIFNSNGVIFWTDVNTLDEYCCININLAFCNEVILAESLGLDLFEQLKPYIRDMKINSLGL